MNAELISVIIRTYNRAESLEKAIWSILNQTYQNFEIIISDDGSTDNTPQVIIKSETDKIIYIQHENVGIKDNGKIGLDTAKGSIITWLDDDDLYAPTYLEEVVNAFNSSDDIGIVSTEAKVITDEGDHHQAIEGDFNTLDNREKIHNLWKAGRGLLVGPATAYRSECYNFLIDSLGEENIPDWNDFAIYPLLLEEYESRLIEKPLYLYTIHADNMHNDLLHRNKVVSQTIINMTKMYKISTLIPELKLLGRIDNLLPWIKDPLVSLLLLVKLKQLKESIPEDEKIIPHREVFIEQQKKLLEILIKQIKFHFGI